MSNTSLVSVIIPFYNRSNLVTETLKNISLQTYTNLEVILVDDGSDVPFKITEDYSFKTQIKHLDENKGPGYARREGRLLAKGKYISYLDSDDWWSHNFIEECVKTIESDAKLGMVYTNTVKMVNGIQVKWRITDKQPTSILPSLFLNSKRFWSTPSCLWRNDVSLANHWLPLRNHEDFLHDFYCSSINNKITFVSTAYTYNNQSASNRIRRDSEEVRKALNEIIKFKKLPSINGISYFFLYRMSKNKLKMEFKDLPEVLKLPSREFNVFSKKWRLFYILVFFNILNVKRTFQKRNINKLK